MNKITNNSRNNPAKKKSSGRRNHSTRRNKIEWYQRARSNQEIGKKKDDQSWEEDRIVYVDERIYMLNNWKIKERILQENHEPEDIGHLEQH